MTMTEVITPALVVVDCQKDFCENGSLPTQGALKIVQCINDKLITKYELIAFSQDWHIDPQGHFDDFPEHCVAFSKGAEFADCLDTSKGMVFQKGLYSAAFSAFEAHKNCGKIMLALDAWLQQNMVTDIIVCGLLLDYCVKSTALDAKARGYNVAVLKNYTLASTDERAIETYNILSAAEIAIL